MMNIQRHEQGKHELAIKEKELVLPFAAIGLSSISIAGGKAANLGELTQAVFPVPPGFCVTTEAYALVAEEAGLEPLVNELAAVDADDTTQLAHLAAAARTRLLAAPIPEMIAEAIKKAYGELKHDAPVPVAVRSSATAEDLPFASFAGQQETYLNIIGLEALLDAVRRCWASLWTDRAVSYRTSLGIEPHAIRLAVAVQQIVDASVAGVLFTAHPLTGRRRQTVIDASPGLGEAVVSGAVNPDHFEVQNATGEIIQRRVGEKLLAVRTTAGGGTRRVKLSSGNTEACLSDEQIRALATLGARVEEHYGAPQDIEWAIDAEGKLWLVQSRPITTLYPLPDNVPESDDVLRAYFCLNVFQGVYRPLTPMGIAVFRLFGSAIAGVFRLPPKDPLRGPAILAEAGGRLFLDVTAALRTVIGRRFLLAAAQVGEAPSASLFQQLMTDPRLALVPTPRWRVIRALGSLLETTRAPLYVAQAWLWPSTLQKRMARVSAWLQSLDDEATAASGQSRTAIAEHLKILEHSLANRVTSVFRTIPAMMISGLGSYALSGWLLKGLATTDEMRIVLRGLPHNPTTEMDLELWALAERVAGDAITAQAVCETPPEQLAQHYHEGSLPPALQFGLEKFLHAYGHRGVAEIDVGLPRWSEDPTHILGVLANYLQLKDPDQAPQVAFQRGAQEAEAMVETLTQRARQAGLLRGALVGFFLKRTRALAGFREMPKFCLVLLLAYTRHSLLSTGIAMERLGCLERADDIFFITLVEAHAALAGEDMHQVVRQRRASYDREMQRRSIPRVLLSDGSQLTVATQTEELAAGTLTGSPASPGQVTAMARVILDPRGARLEPGEVLVAPSTDPGWTPLFLTASGLIMEMGGTMSHGAVVAREHGIPAVVGVPGATKRITTGQRITVDGSTGKVFLF